MYEKGFIKIDRQVFEEALWSDARRFSKFEAWLDLHRMANYKEGNQFVNGYTVVTQKRGEVFTSKLKLSESWKWHRRTVDSFLKMLKDMRKIDYEVTTHYTRIYLLDYGNNQDAPAANMQPIVQQSAQQTSKSIATVEQPLTIIKESNKVINKESNFNFDNSIVKKSEYTLVEDFNPKDSGGALCLEIAKLLEEKYINPTLSLYKQVGLNLMQTAFVRYKEQVALSKETINNPGAYFRTIVLNLMKEAINKK